jgi:hypothetical protein
MTSAELVESLARYGFTVDPDDKVSLSAGLLATHGYMDYESLAAGNITNYIERTVGLLIEQFRREKPRMVGVVSAVADQCQKIEDTLFDLLRFRGIQNATGAQLDRIGGIVGLSRTGVDDQYRSDLYFQIAINTSHSTPEDLIQILQKVTKATTIDYIESYPAGVVMTINKALAPIPSNILIQIRRVKPGGVRLNLTFNDSSIPFIFGQDVGSVAPLPFVGEGFGETGNNNINEGGNLTELIGAGS